MCGRFTLTSPQDQIESLFGVSDVPELQPRYNIAPSQDVLVIVQEREERHALMMRWGLVPSWAKDLSIGNRCINARSETASQKNSFRQAFAQRRCLIPMNGFYEWQSLNGTKQPFYLGLEHHDLGAFAGLWEEWTHPETGASVNTCTIMTTTPNELVRSYHDRMPVILSTADQAVWMAPDATLEKTQALLRPLAARLMTAYPVSSRVGNVVNDDESLIQRVEMAQQMLL